MVMISLYSYICDGSILVFFDNGRLFLILQLENIKMVNCMILHIRLNRGYDKANLRIEIVRNYR